MRRVLRPPPGVDVIDALSLENQHRHFVIQSSTETHQNRDASETKHR